MAKTPTVNKLQLGALLRKYRVDAELSQEQLGQKVFQRASARTAQSKLAAIENGDRSPHESELKTMQIVLGIEDPAVLDKMEFMLQHSSQRGRWGGYRAVYDDEVRKYIDLEEDSDRIRDIAVGLMPDLLMCEAYVRVVFEGRAQSDELLQASVDARLSRTSLLEQGDESRQFHFILCESAVRKTPRGNRAVIREQIAHVIALSKRENVKIQVIPFVRTELDTLDPMLYPFTSLRVPTEGIASSLEYVRIGAPDDRRYLDDKQAIDVYDRRFTDATEAGIGGEDARRFMKEISREYR